MVIARPYLVLALGLALTVLGEAVVCGQDTTATPARDIIRVRGDLYLVRDGQQYTVFLATPKGIILADPLSYEAALWLRDEIGGRFEQRTRFVLHTWHHYTRSAGSSVFNDSAEIVARPAFVNELAKAQRKQPERYRFAVRMTVAFSSERLPLTLGGSTVNLIHVPSSRMPEMTVLHFAGQRVVFAIAPPWLNRVPFSFGEFQPRDVFAWFDTIAPLEFDSLVLSDGRIMSRSEFDDLSTYLSAVRAAVVTGIKKGLTLTDVQASSGLEKHRASPHYANAAAQLSDIYSSVKSLTISMSGGAASRYARLSRAFCAVGIQCTGGGTVPAARFTLSITTARTFDLTGELTLSGQSSSTRSDVVLRNMLWGRVTGQTNVDEEAATRRSRGALLVRYVRQASRFSYAAVGGASLTIDDVRGLRYFKGLATPMGGSHPFEQRYRRMGVTFGGDIDCPLGRSIKVRLPIRITRMPAAGPGEYMDSSFDVQAGVDITFPLFRRLSFR